MTDEVNQMIEERENKNTIELKVGADIGNSTVMITVDGSKKNEPITYIQPAIYVEFNKRPIISDEPIEEIIDSLDNNIIAQVNSPSIKRISNYLVGERAFEDAGIKRNMDITNGNKANNNVPIILVVSMIATHAMKTFYGKNENIPENLIVKTKLVTAIPCRESSKEARTTLVNRYIGKHDVTLYIGTETVNVSVIIEECKVTEEGNTGMLTILKNLSKMSALSPIIAGESSKFTNKDLRSLMFDIGDGTTEKNVMRGSNPIIGLSGGDRLGVGHATVEAISLLSEEITLSSNFTRQDFQNWVKMDNERGKIARDCRDRAIGIQADLLVEFMKNAFTEDANSNIEYAFVFGGGSIVFREEIQEEMELFAENNGFKMIWIPEEFAVLLNTLGTYYLAQSL